MSTNVLDILGKPGAKAKAPSAGVKVAVGVLIALILLLGLFVAIGVPTLIGVLVFPALGFGGWATAGLTAATVVVWNVLLGLLKR